MRGKKTRYFGICIAVIAIMLGLMLACGGCLIYVYFARRDILETILARYYAMMGIEFTGIDMTSMWMEIIIYGLDIAILIYYLVKCAKFMKMTQEEFMKKNSKQILDVLLLFITGVIPAIVYLIVCEANKTDSREQEKVYLPNGVNPDITNIIRTLQEYRDSGRITQETYEKMLLDIFTEHK